MPRLSPIAVRKETTYGRGRMQANSLKRYTISNKWRIWWGTTADYSKPQGVYWHLRTWTCCLVHVQSRIHLGNNDLAWDDHTRAGEASMQECKHNNIYRGWMIKTQLFSLLAACCCCCADVCLHAIFGDVLSFLNSDRYKGKEVKCQPVRRRFWVGYPWGSLCLEVVIGFRKELPYRRLPTFQSPIYVVLWGITQTVQGCLKTTENMTLVSAQAHSGLQFCNHYLAQVNSHVLVRALQKNVNMR